MSNTYFRFMAILGLAVLLCIAGGPVLAADDAVTGRSGAGTVGAERSGQQTTADQPGTPDRSRGQTSDQYGTQPMQPRSGMSPGAPPAAQERYGPPPAESTMNQPTTRQKERGQTADFYGTEPQHPRSGMSSGPERPRTGDRGVRSDETPAPARQ